MATDRKVTGQALEKILNATKVYIDSKDMGFLEVEIDENGEFNIPELILCQHDVYREDIEEMLNEEFFNLNNNDNTK